MMIETTPTSQPAIQAETFADLTAAATSSTAFWDNPLDDEDWNNLHIGSSFDDFLAEEGILAEVETAAI